MHHHNIFPSTLLLEGIPPGAKREFSHRCVVSKPPLAVFPDDVLSELPVLAKGVESAARWLEMTGKLLSDPVE